MMLLDPVQPIDKAAAWAPQGDLRDDNNEDQPEVAQSEDLQDPTNLDSTPHVPAV
jgi:hypothetical protein